MKIEELKKLSTNLQKAFLKPKNKDEIFSFIRDLLTENEIIEFSQRLQIADMLNKGVSYKEIEKITGASSTTVARVAGFLRGKYGGYRNILK